MTTQRVYRAAALSVAIFTGLGVPAALAGPAGWEMPFAENARLPKDFRQWEIPRSDGSPLTAFLACLAPAAGAERRPLMIYLDGSGAQSLFVSAGERVGCTTWGLLAQTAGARFHVVAAEKRGVKFLDNLRPGVSEGASDDYLRHATLDGRVADVRVLIDALANQPAVDSSKIVLVGHSEGAVVAAAVAAVEPRVTHVAFLSGGGPTQFFDLLVLQRRRLLEAGKSLEEIETEVSQLERQFGEILAEPQSIEKFFAGHTYRRWASFGQHPPIDALLKSKCRLFLAHGTEDESVPIEAFDLLTVELLRAGRKDVTVHRYAGYDHGLTKRGGKPRRWIGDVFRDVVSWVGEASPAADRAGKQSDAGKPGSEKPGAAPAEPDRSAPSAEKQ
ncbi:MAG: alpha/beta fold hydrolase [Phycisphaerae bacterium]